MTADRALQSSSALVEQAAGDDHVSHELPHVDSPWMLADECAAYMKFPDLRAFYRWIESNRDFPRSRRGKRVLVFERRVVDAYLRGELRRRPVKPVTLRVAHGSASVNSASGER